MLAALAAAGALAAGCGGGDADTESGAESAAGGNQVTVNTFIFKPKPIEIEAGETVTWTNEDSALHTVTSGTREDPDERFDGELPESGGTFETSFDEPGTYEYFCSIHSGPGMEGSVVVR